MVPTHPLVFMLRVSERIRESDNEYRNPDLSELESDLEELKGTSGISRVISKMRNPSEFFDERASLWFAAKYKRRGWRVEFIPEIQNKETPDLSLHHDKLGTPVTMEVKHIDLRVPVFSAIRTISEIPSRYSVDLTISEELLYENQAANFASVIASRLRKMSETPDGVRPLTEELPGKWRFGLIPNSNRELRPTVVRMVHWPRLVQIPKIRDRLLRILDKARGQLVSYSPEGVNVIALYVDDSSVSWDTVKATLYEEPGLFNSKDYEGVTAAKYVVQRITHDEELFPNANNVHVGNGQLKSLEL